MHIRNYLATLDFVNDERRMLGLAPLDHLPLGRPGDTRECVIARAVPGSVVTGMEIQPASRTGFGEAPSTAPRLRKILPATVRLFVAGFDSQGSGRGAECDPGELVQGGIEDDKGCLVPA